MSICLITVILGLLWGSLLERGVHKASHRYRWLADGIFTGHSVHHARFPRGGPYRLEESEGQRWIPPFVKDVPTGIILGFVGMAPFLIAMFVCWYFFEAVEAAKIIGTTGAVVTGTVLPVIEIVHQLSHTQDSQAPKWRVLAWLYAYHHRHHDRGDEHYNVALPLADWVVAIFSRKHA